MHFFTLSKKLSFNATTRYTRHDVFTEANKEEEKEKKVRFSAKNISDRFLEVQAEELTERFIRGDQSRQTEGSGLGLSIAKNLIEAQGGRFEIQVDGDLFKAIITFPLEECEKKSE